MRIEAGPRQLVGCPLLVVLVLIGCGRPDVVPFSPAEQNLTKVAMAYGDAHGKLGRGPNSAEELKPFLKQFGDPDELLVSPNDGQPLVVIWGGDPSRGGPTAYKGMFPILAHEKVGKGGRRAVTDTRGRPMSVPEEDFPKLTFVRGRKAGGD